MSTHFLTDTQCDTCKRSVLVDGISIAQHQEWGDLDLHKRSKDLCSDCQKRTVFYCPYCVGVHLENEPCDALRALLEVLPMPSLSLPEHLPNA